MANNCGICGRKIGMMMESYEIIGTEEQKCLDCVKKMDIIRSKTRKDEDAKEEIEYFKNIIASGNISSEVKEYLTEYLENGIYAFKFEQQRKEEERAEREKQKKLLEKQKSELIEQVHRMKITSGFNYEGYRIVEYYDYIVEESAMGIGAFKSMFNEMSEFWGTESSGARKRLKQGKTVAMDRLKYEAAIQGANAIIGIDLDYSTFSNDTLVVVASGTAVKIEKIED